MGFTGRENTERKSKKGGLLLFIAACAIAVFVFVVIRSQTALLSGGSVELTRRQKQALDASDLLPRDLAGEPAANSLGESTLAMAESPNHLYGIKKRDVDEAARTGRLRLLNPNRLDKGAPPDKPKTKKKTARH